MSEPQNGGLKRYICRQHNPDFEVQNINTQGYKNALKNLLRRKGNQNQNVDD